MTILPVERDYIIVDIPQGSLHIWITDKNETEISWYDHASITLKGSHKNKPLLILDSDEYPTKLGLHETECKWIPQGFKLGE